VQQNRAGSFSKITSMSSGQTVRLRLSVLMRSGAIAPFEVVAVSGCPALLAMARLILW
jgi:hypothetical protein